MVDWSLVQFVLFLGAPYIIRYGTALFRKDATSSIRPPRNEYDYGVIGVCIAVALYQIAVGLLWRPFNVFRFVSIPFDAHPMLLKDRLMYYNETILDYSGASGETLLGALKSQHSRVTYAIFGQDALLNCDFCKEHADYLLYLLPKIASSYAFMLVIIGLVSMTNRKEQWRSWGTIGLTVIGAVELYTFSTTNVVMTSDEQLFANLERYRRFAFGALLIVVAAIDTHSNQTDVMILENLIDAQQSIITKAKFVSLVRTAVMRDTNLRRIYSDYYKRMETVDSLVSQDEEYMQARGQAMQQFDADQLFQEAETFVDNVVQSGLETLNSRMSREIPGQAGLF